MSSEPQVSLLAKVGLALRIWSLYPKVPELVIGLQETPADEDAHAWVELDGMEVGPAPGSGPLLELAHFK